MVRREEKCKNKQWLVRKKTPWERERKTCKEDKKRGKEKEEETLM